MKARVLLILSFLLLTLAGLFGYQVIKPKSHISIKSNFEDKKSQDIKQDNTIEPKAADPQPPKEENKEFSDQFSTDYTLIEDGSITKSKNPDWWVNSGAYLYASGGVARTVFGNLEENSSWRLLYSKNNSGETDNGFHPQNIFRLVTKSKWKNFEQQAYYKIAADNLSTDSHRSGSNGLLLFNRYQDGNNLYYTGIRVDGKAVIKKKIKSTYYTMAQQTIFPGEYDRVKTPTLLPKNKWLGLKSKVIDNADGTVDIELYTDLDNTGNWTLVMKAKDDNSSYGGHAITEPGYAGIRTDFMDVEFDNYKITETN